MKNLIDKSKEHHLPVAFYKEIVGETLYYGHVLLSNTTNAKSELHSYLKNGLHFKDVKIDIEPADRVTKNDKTAFVRNHYYNQ